MLVCTFQLIGVLCSWNFALQGATVPNSLPQSLGTLIAEGKDEFHAGHSAAALEIFQRVAKRAQADRDLKSQATALVAASACELRLFRYRAALSSAEQAHHLAVSIGNDFLAGIAAGNLSTTYMQLGDFAPARQAADEAVSCFEKTNSAPQLVQALVNSEYLVERDPVKAQRLSARAVAVAQRAGLKQIEAYAWDVRAALILKNGDHRLSPDALNQLEQAVGHAYSVRTQIHDSDGLGLTNEHRAELAFHQHRYGEALRLIDGAFAASTPTFRDNPAFYPIHVRARILLALGRKNDALREFKRAVTAASQWRQGALPGDATSTQTVAMLHAVYQDYIEVAAERSLKTSDPVLAREALEALAENRAASLREQMVLTLGRDLLLPPRYFEQLRHLQSLQARVTLGQNSNENVQALNQARLELSRLSNEIGIHRNNSEAYENSSGQKSLKDIQLRLSATEVLFSFCLGEKHSFLWAVTRNSLGLYGLASQTAIEEQATAFSAAVRRGEAKSAVGGALRSTLFNQLRPAITHKRDWLIIGDGVLLSGIPFSALPENSTMRKTELLAEKHTLRFLPSERLLLVRQAGFPQRCFVGIADPIYNLADSRRTHSRGLVPEANASPSPVNLARLVSSSREVHTAAIQSDLPRTQILTGKTATGELLRAALSQRPELIHFAVHVVSPEGRPEEAALALSLTGDNIPELLTPETVASYRVPGSLVVLSGCFSQQGQALPSAGLIGLSRAWLLAGASAVVVSAWPTPDDSGQFFSSFYKHLATHTKANRTSIDSLGQRAAAALQEAQIDMQRSSQFRNAPSFWAAYSVISKE